MSSRSRLPRHARGCGENRENVACCCFTCILIGFDDARTTSTEPDRGLTPLSQAHELKHQHCSVKSKQAVQCWKRRPYHAGIVSARTGEAQVWKTRRREWLRHQ
ncbi:hypothetical protein N657DRAFT_334805 [Parathielavia appendiculata]|uniref:Uncharacterized protein n=1 Tax=Parathielavia appendiculata TaxID=2587402 RepID=A0AAN6U1Q1_9PEZI|nr:hypothetical protein N657DRAFT_334805 [Parathielavia appendiculata]